jgi:hypothetical protein
MDRQAQIDFLERCEERVQGHVSKWLDDSAVREALHRRPEGHEGAEEPRMRRVG